jgi:hypothetical protein
LARGAPSPYHGALPYHGAFTRFFNAFTAWGISTKLNRK